MKYSELVASTQEKIDSDTDFQNSLADLSDEDKQQAISAKQQELIDAELAAVEEKANKAQQNYENQKIRAEKAEAEAKKPKEKETPKNETLTAKDILALRDVEEPDVDFILSEAKLRGLSIAETKANPYVKIALKQMAEERKTAEATQTKTTRASGSSASKEAVLKRAFNGELKDDEMKGAAQEAVKSIFGR